MVGRSVDGSPRSPKDLLVQAQCRHCGGTLGLFHVVEGGTLVLGKLTCEWCGVADKPARIIPEFRGERPEVSSRVELDSVLHIWPETDG